MSRIRFIGLLVAMTFVLSLSPSVGAWGSSVHHDQAIIISNALESTPSVPQDVLDNIDSDLIYATSLAPDDWRNVTGKFGTYQFNMAENAYYEFRRIRDAWRNEDYDNAIARIGVAMHYVGDAIQMAHNQDLRRWYQLYIEPLGSDAPIWNDEESGAGEYSHQVRQQIESYSDSDSVWYPTQPENYGQTENAALGTDDGSLDWFLAYFYDPAIDNDSPSTSYADTVMGRHIIQTSPYADDPYSTDQKEDNRWFYWVDTRDAAISKMDFDNSTRLVYNGVYRAIRDAYIEANGEAAWPWPTQYEYSSLNDDLYKEGMDSIRWYEGISTHGSTTGDSDLNVAPDLTPTSNALLAVAAVMFLVAFVVWRKSGKSSRGGSREKF